MTPAEFEKALVAFLARSGRRPAIETTALSNGKLMIKSLEDSPVSDAIERSWCNVGGFYVEGQGPWSDAVVLPTTPATWSRPFCITDGSTDQPNPLHNPEGDRLLAVLTEIKQRGSLKPGFRAAKVGAGAVSPGWTPMHPCVGIRLHREELCAVDVRMPLGDACGGVVHDSEELPTFRQAPRASLPIPTVP